MAEEWSANAGMAVPRYISPTNSEKFAFLLNNVLSYSWDFKTNPTALTNPFLLFLFPGNDLLKIMNKKNLLKYVVLSLFLTAFSIGIYAQKDDKTKPLITRTKHTSETVEFGSGGTISITGAPLGSVQVEGWNKAEVEISAEIIVQAANEF